MQNCLVSVFILPCLLSYNMLCPCVFKYNLSLFKAKGPKVLKIKITFYIHKNKENNLQLSLIYVCMPLMKPLNDEAFKQPFVMLGPFILTPLFEALNLRT